MKCDAKRCIIAGTVFQLLMACGAYAQELQAPPEVLQSKIRQMQQAKLQNQQKLHRYQWIQTTTFSVDGDSRPPKQSICRYAADGTVQKTPLGQQETRSDAGRSGDMPLRGGGLFRRVIAEKKKEKYKSEIEQIRAIGKMYMPFDRAKLQAAFHEGRVSIEHEGRTDSIVIKSYVKNGDQVKLTVDDSTLEFEHITVKTYIDDPKDTLTANVQFAALEDGTRYRSMLTVDASKKKVSVTLADGSYQLIN